MCVSGQCGDIFQYLLCPHVVRAARVRSVCITRNRTTDRAYLRRDPKFCGHPMLDVENWKDVFVPYLAHGDADRNSVGFLVRSRHFEN